MAHTPEHLERLAGAGLAASPVHEVLIEESVLGWKEYELELMRDRHDNVVVVCSIENIDPMGVHTGDSVTVAPAMTLTDREYQHLRDVGHRRCCVRSVSTPADATSSSRCTLQPGRLVVIEMNPRVSRSSALASKATGFPIAKIAAKLAIGYTLDEIPNDITLQTPAAFEPALDYVVVKIPRFAFEKFPGADPELTTTMKSVGEAMSLGRNFTEALNKAMRSMETPQTGFWTRPGSGRRDVGVHIGGSGHATRRPAVHCGASTAAWRQRGGGVPRQRRHRPVVRRPDRISGRPRAEVTDAAVLDLPLLRRAKRAGLSDAQLAALRPELAGEDGVRALRHRLDLHPVYKTVDTCAAEFAAATPYHYSSYDQETEVSPSDRPKVIILGSGPNRIGQGIEFDYSCVHAAQALSAAGFETVMVQLQSGDRLHRLRPADRLYFEPLTFEDVLEVFLAEDSSGKAAGGPGVVGVIVQLGGQTPLGLARPPQSGRLPIVGTHAGVDPPRRGPRCFRTAPRGGRPSGAGPRHGHLLRRCQADRRRNRLPGPGTTVLCARWAGHGDRVRRRHPALVHHPGHRHLARTPGAGGPVPRRRHRDRCRRPGRRHR
jgi:carbamoyl-phosphate synthase large subunit